MSEAQRIRLAHLFDAVLAVHASNLERLPHQITAVYEAMLPRQPLRFLLADDPGAGKTIMAGLLIKELIARGDLERCLVVCPGSLAEQWQDELYRRFHLPFEILTRDKLEAARTGNWFLETPLVIARLDMLSRREDLQAKLEAPDCGWDLVVCDEAHKLSATFFGGEVNYTKRYRLGRLLSSLSRHFLLMTATPHNGKEEDFQLFMALLDSDRFEGRFRDGVHTADVSDLMRRMVKEHLLTFEGKPLFPERIAYTVPYTLSEADAGLYAAVTDYVRQELNRAETLANARRAGTVGFALTILQDRITRLLGRETAVVVIHGGMGREDRLKAQEAFRHDPEVSVLLATDAAGEGSNLQRAHLMVNYDLPWNPNRLEQRFGRIHRIGETEVCRLWNLVAQETREGDVYRRLLEKLEQARQTLGGQVFDVLGKLEFEGRPLRGLLIDAIRYGEQPEVRARLDTAVDHALDRHNCRTWRSSSSPMTRWTRAECAASVRTRSGPKLGACRPRGRAADPSTWAAWKCAPEPGRGPSREPAWTDDPADGGCDPGRAGEHRPDKGGRPDADWKAGRVRADPPAALAEVRTGAALTIYGACGVPTGLATLPADATGQREAWRRFPHGSVSPVARLVEAELRDKLDEPDLRLTFDVLYAADVTGRARAWRSLVGAQATMDPDRQPGSRAWTDPPAGAGRFDTPPRHQVRSSTERTWWCMP